jgi:hypothetical protein
LDIVTAFQELGSYRAAAALCGTTHKTVRRVVERREAPPPEHPPRPKLTDPHRELIAAKVKDTHGRISAKRLLARCRAAGYEGSARTLRRAVAEAKAEHRRQRRVYRPWQPVPGEHASGSRRARRRTGAAFLALGPAAGWGLLMATDGDFHLAIDSQSPLEVAASSRDREWATAARWCCPLTPNRLAGQVASPVPQDDGHANPGMGADRPPRPIRGPLTLRASERPEE